MELFFSTGACSLAPHILLNEVSGNYKLHKVDMATRKTDTGLEFASVNPKNQVPTLKLENGEILTENAVVLQHIADKYPEKNLLPKWGTWERTKANEWLNFVATEIHKGMGIFFALDRLMSNQEAKEEFRKNQTAALGKKFSYLSEHLSKNQFLLGNHFTAPDAYLFTILNWHGFLKIDLTPWPHLMGYMERVKSRPAVQAAMRKEGLIK